MDRSITISWLLFAALAPTAFADDATTTLVIPAAIQSVIDARCADCHGGDMAEGDVRFDTLADMELEARLELLNKAHEQLYFGKMPPEDAEQPSESERAQLVNWVVKELNQHNAARLEDKLRKPEYGNYVDHDKLFSGEYAHLPGFTYDRRWLISEFIFDARFNRILNHSPFRTIDGKRQFVIGDNNRRGVNLTNPFLLPTNTGVRYYADETLNGGHLLTMIKTIGNWYTTLLNAHGNPIDHYGDLDLEMSRKKLDQTGAIKELMG